MKYILRRVVQSEAFLQKRNLLQKNVVQQNPNHFTCKLFINILPYKVIGRR